MLILELTLGQKMQKGSAGALRGISPRLGGFGWVASFAGFITCIVYCIFLGMCMLYLVNGGSEPWEMAFEDRPLSCQTAAKASTNSAEIYLWNGVTKFFGDDTCSGFTVGKEATMFAGPLFLCAAISWVICFLCIIKGVKSSSYVVMITVPAPFVFMFALIAYYASLNASNLQEGMSSGIDFMWSVEPVPLVSPGPMGEIYYDPASVNDKIFFDAITHAFFSVGVCVGVMYAYGSFNDIKKPVIMDAFIIAFSDLTFSILAGFCVWSVIGFLYSKNNLAYAQTSGVGLMFVAFPIASKLDEGGKAFLGLFFATCFLAGIDSAFSYIESSVTNIVDIYQCSRWKAALVVCISGILLTIPFTSNYGWVLMDMVDHYISDYILVLVGLAQCIAVGWLFEYETTAANSPCHASSLRWMSVTYWMSAICWTFFGVFGFSAGYRIWAILLCVLFMLIGFVISWRKSEMTMKSWYHEIFFCGVDKLSMSITSLSNEDGSRSWWMYVFEAWFGLTIKFFVPFMMLWMLFFNMRADLKEPYGGNGLEIQVYAAIYVMIALFIIFVPMFVCSHPEKFFHNVNLEFIADQVYSDSLQKSNKIDQAQESELMNT
jgi:NSS family neurotransmitter:Na+ symporter